MDGQTDVFWFNYQKSVTPVLYILGGPGLIADSYAPRLDALSKNIRRPVIVISSPGAEGKNLDRFDCLPTASIWVGNTEDVTPQYSASADLTAIDDCADHLNGLPAGWHTRITPARHARQIKNARQAMGIKRWHIIAESFGFHALMALRQIDSDSIMKIILDSPDTPWVQGYYHFGSNIAEAVRKLSNVCKGTKRCPIFRDRFHRLVAEKLTGNWTDGKSLVDIVHPDSGAVIGYIRPSTAQVTTRLVSKLMTVRKPTTLPYVFGARSEEKYRDRLSILFRPKGHTPENNVSFGTYHGMRCQTLPLDNWYQALAEDAAEYPYLSSFLNAVAERQRRACAGLGLSSPKSFQAYDLNGLNAFIIGGRFDPATPENVVRTAFENTPSVQFRYYANEGHVVSGTQPCIAEDIRTYLDDGVPPRSTACSKSDLRLRYYAPVKIF